jgi:serine/threonine protein kinase/WD40 repeat protein
MAESTSETDVFSGLAHEFVERYRRGERPSLNEYVDRYPELAEDIKELFPALVMMEKVGSEGDRPSTPGIEQPRSSEPMPERLGDYRILRELGRGGMGIVYEAVQESLGRHVALKVLSHNRPIERIQLMRFEREARAAALLHHTNIVPIFFVGEQEGIHYYAMQYIQGQGLDVVLREFITRGRDGRLLKTSGQGMVANPSGTMAARLVVNGSSTPTVRLKKGTDTRSSADRPGDPRAPVSMPALAEGSPPTEWPSSPSSTLGRTENRYYRMVARLGIQVAEALEHAHRHGVLHRDIKPANLLLDFEGTIWVTDFGLAKSEGNDELTSPGDVVGTLRYMAPERFQGKAGPRSDIYSLGLTLYEMLTLRPAFTASHRAQLIHTILHADPDRPRKHDRDLPRDLETIVLKAIAKNPPDRFASARELAAELRRFFEGRPIHSRRLSMPERTWRWSRRNPALAVLTLLAVTLTSILMVGSAAAAWKFREQRDVVRVAKRTTEVSLDRALMAEREGRVELGRSLLRQARAVRYSGQPGRRADALKTLASAAQIAHEHSTPLDYGAELRDEVIAAAALTDDRPVQSWPGLKLPPSKMTISGDADRYVELGDEGSIHVYRLSDRSPIQILGADRPSTRSWPRFVPGGRFLLVPAGRANFELWDLERGEISASWPADAKSASPRVDGGQVAVLRSDGFVQVYDLPALTEAVRCRVPYDRKIQYSGFWMSLSEDGRYLAFMQDEPMTVVVYELATGRIVREVKVPAARVHRTLALSRTGALLAIVHDRAISVFDVASGEELARLQGHQSEGITAQFQPGGGLLASTGWDGTTRLWDPVRGHLLVTLRGNLCNWNVGGAHLEILDSPELIRYEIAAGKERRTIDCRLLGDSAGATLYGPARLSYSPDGQLIAMALRPDGVRIARAADGLELVHLPIGDCDEVLFLAGGALLTHNGRGLCRWPVRHLTSGTLRMGAPEPLALIEQPASFINWGLSSSASGRLVGANFPAHPGPMLIDPDQPWRRTWLTPHDVLAGLAISPDGRWVATAGRRESPDDHQVKVWDVPTGKTIVEIPAAYVPLAFSPDGRWLGVGIQGGYRFFRTGSWTPGPKIDQGGEGANIPLAFHPDSRVAAVLDTKSLKVRLVDVETGATLAMLESPESTWTSCLVFSPDGRYLATAQSDQRANIWDLSLIRRRLEALHLSTGFPDVFRSRERSAVVPTVERIEFDGAARVGLKFLVIRQALQEVAFAVWGLVDPHLDDAEELLIRGDRWARLGQWPLAVADYRASVARCPDSSVTANNVAWQLAFAPGSDFAEESVRLARKAVAMEPDAPNPRNTLGVALYRAGHLEEAAAILESNAPRNPNGGHDWLYLAMCNQRLGRVAQARAAVKNALTWRATAMRFTRAQDAEFRELLQEAQTVVNGGIPELPADVFSP